MDTELDKGHAEPVFGPPARTAMTERFRLAREIVREFGGQAAASPDRTARRRATDNGDDVAARRSLAEVVDSWQTAWSLLYAPVDDEPFTPEEAAAADAALERVRQGQGVFLDDLDLIGEDEPSR